MNLKEFVLTFGLFILIFYSANSFFFNFNRSVTLPEQINASWYASTAQIEEMRAKVSSSVNQIVSGNLLEKISGVFSLAFNGIFYIILSLWTTFITIPQQIFGAINYLASAFGIPKEIVTIIISIITIIVILKAIEFVTGRYFA